jgi:hypothetical protein
MGTDTTWQNKDAVAFTAGTLSTIDDCRSDVEANIHRGTLSSSTTPTATQVDNWIIRAKQEMMERYGFSWRRCYAYASSESGAWLYALPKDFSGGATILRDTTGDVRLDFVDRITFDTLYPDPSENSAGPPDFYTIKDRELWLAGPTDGVYVFELEYQRTGDDTTSTDISYIPESIRFKLCDYATHRAFLALQQWEASQIYKAEWEGGVQVAKKGNSTQRWAEMGYQIKNWFYKK